MRRSSWLGIALLAIVAAVLAAMPALTARSAPNDVIPQIIETNPAAGEELPPNGSITFTFNTAMDRASVEAALLIKSADGKQTVSGTFKWNSDTSVTFTPAKPLTRATEYIATFKPGAKSQGGIALKDIDTYRLRTVGALAVTQIIPATGTKDVDANAVITVIFNRPVVPVTPVEQMGILPNPVTITPAVKGQGTWVNTSIYQFKPSEPLKGGTQYTVTVKAGLTDTTGATLPNDTMATFTTLSPRTLEIRPEDKGVDIVRDPVIEIGFSQPMDQQATQAAFALTGPGGAKVEGTFDWKTDFKSFTFKPKALLNYGGLYDITIDANTARSASGAVLQASAKSSFTVVTMPEIVKTTPANGEVTTYTGVDIHFSAPMKLDDFEKRVSVDPKPPKLDVNISEYDPNNAGLALAVEDNTTYTVTIDPKGLTDIWGTPLQVRRDSKVYTVTADSRIQIKFTIHLQFDPSAALQTAGNIGLYSAYAPTTRVYSTHRNIKELDLQLWKLSVDQAIPLLGTNSYEAFGSFSPNDKDFLRAWKVPVENPPQVLRYDLLNISASGPSTTANTSSFTCPGAPPTRLRQGVTVVVLRDDPTPLNVRAQPNAKANVLVRINPGVSFQILGGPQCADGYIWWQTAYQGQTGWVAEGDNTHYFIGPADNSSASAQPTRPVAAAGTGKEPLKPGIYWLTLASPDVRSGSPLRHAMIVATANITLKMGPTAASAWVTDLQSGQPVAGAKVRFLMGKERKEVGTAPTDAKGVASIAYPLVNSLYETDLVAVVDDGTNFGIGSNNLSQGIEPYNYNLNADYFALDQTIYLYSDRSLYKPGQPVYFKGVLRSKRDVTYAMVNRKTIPIEVFDDKNQSVYKTDAALTDFGTFSGQFTFDAKAPLGYYRIVASLGDPNAKNPDERHEFSRLISVAEYRTPEFQVKATADKDQVVQGDKVKVEVDSSFFFGGAVNNVPVEWSVLTDDYYFNYAGQGSYSFEDFDEDAGPREYNSQYGNSIAAGKGTTDANGKFVIEVPADLGKSKQSQVYVIEARVTDEAGQLVAARAQVIVHAGELYLGAAPEEYVGTAKQPARINVIAVDWDSKPLPNTEISVRAVEREWHSVKQVSPEDGRTIWTYDVKENPIDSSTVRTDADGKAAYTFTPPRGGSYKVYVTTRDAKGNQITASTFVYVAGPDYVPWRQRNSYSIELKADRTDYKVGDTVSILIPSPFQGAAKAWVTVERGGILKSEVIDLPTNSTVYKLPIDASFAPNAFVSVMVVKGVDDKNPVPAFRLGLVAINVDAERYKLNIAVKPDKEQAGPREQVNYTLKVTDYTGKPIKAEVGVRLTDLAALSLLPDTSTPILQHFYDRQGLGVRTASTLTISVDEQTQTILNTVKGGGGGGPEGGLFEVRQLFLDTPLWKPGVQTDENGVATVNVTLPDQLTTWRLDARAVTLPTGELNTTLVGQTTFDLLSTKPLLIRPLTPRFFVVGDTSTLAAVVNNNTGADQQVTVRIALKGGTLSTPDTQTLTIKNGQRTRIEWPVTISDVPNVDVTFFANTADNKYTDAAKSAVGQGDDKVLPIYRYEAPETVSTSGVIDKTGGSRVEGIVLPKALNVTQGDLNVRLDPSLAAVTTDALKSLDQTRYDCTEQTVSKFLPNLMTYRALDQLQISKPELKQQLDEQINIALQRLYSQQHVDGGWGWCVEDKSAGHVTAYALLGLAEAKRGGYTVDDSVMTKAIAFIRGQLQELGDQADTYQLNRQSFMLYVLARAGVGNVSRSVRLFSIREKLSIYARAYLLMTFNILKDTTRIAPLISDLQNSAITSASGQHWQESYQDYWNWNTDTRTTAIALQALTEVQPTNGLLPNVVRWLMVARKADAWETTQETAWAVMALTDWMLSTGELRPSYTFSAALNDKPLAADQQATADTVRNAVILRVQVADLIAGDVNRLAINRTAGDGVLYYTANLNAYLPVEQVKALSRGLTITRQYSLAGDKTNKPITEAHVGDSIRVTLTIIAPSDMHYVSVTDPIPAGAEAINPDLATSSSVGTQPELKLQDPLDQGYGWWWFGDTQLRDEATVLSAEYLPAGTYKFTYVIRAGLAGKYHVIPATAQEYYFPEVYGRSEGLLFMLLPAVDPSKDPAQGTK